MREHDHGMRARLAIVVFIQEAAERRAHPEHREIRAGDDLGPDQLRRLPRRDGQVHRRRVAAEHTVEEPGLLSQVAADRIRHQVETGTAAPRLRERVALPVDEDEPLRLAHGQEAEEHLVQEREDRGAGPDADGQRRHRRDRESRAPREAAPGVAGVPGRVVEPAQGPGLPHVLLDLLDSAHLDGGLFPGLVFAVADGAQVLDAAVEVIAQLAVEVPLEPRAPASEQVQDLAHGSRLPRCLNLRGMTVRGRPRSVKPAPRYCEDRRSSAEIR